LKVLAVDATLAIGGRLMSLLDMCLRTARRIFGIERLRPEESAMVAILGGCDALAALPTGFGRSTRAASSSRYRPRSFELAPATS